MRRVVLLWVAVTAISLFLAGSTPASASNGGRAPAVNCSSALKLHDGTNQSGATASISSRGVWVNLSSFSFDNRTSSFTTGACAVALASAANGGGALYETCLTAHCVENVMDPGWDNVISSVYLY